MTPPNRRPGTRVPWRAGASEAASVPRTIRRFAACDLNVKRTARHLKLHANTVYFRLNRIKKLSGVDPRSFSGASLLLTALRLLERKNGGNGRERWK